MPTISDFTNGIRLLSSTIQIGDKKNTLASWLATDMLLPFQLSENWLTHNPQLKTYIQIDLASPIEESMLEQLLYDIGNISPLGSAKGIGLFAPSENYFKEQMAQNKISVFKNWSALCLFDTFTRISFQQEDKFKSWEHDYYPLYVYAHFIKYFMYLTNARLTDITSLDAKTKQIRNIFISFINDHYHTHVAYKFLPNLILKKLCQSLEIETEIEKMEIKIQRINTHREEKSDKTMNSVLIMLTLLSIFSVVSDLSDWLVKLGISETSIFPKISISLLILIFVMVVSIFRFKRR